MSGPLLLVMRHGQTDHNLEGRIQGQLAVPLNARGHEQARELAAALADSPLRPARLVASDLLRARQTAEIVRSVLDLPAPRESPLWRARLLGAFQGRTRAELREEGAPGFRDWQADPLRVAPPGGERGLDQRERVRRGLEEIRPSFEEHPILGVVTHEGCLRAALALARGGAPDWRTTEFGNGAVLALSPGTGGWDFVELYRSLATLR